jgi:tripartite-type tricarboxylate transporter receptor subunit TctC
MRRRDLMAAATLLPGLAHAQAEWPTRAVQMVVAFPPGGQADISARPLAAMLERQQRQPFPVVNRPGAGGAVGNASVARAAADGYTLLVALSSLAMLPEADRLHGRPPAYELDQFVPIARITADPTVLVVPTASPWRSVEDLVAAARATPGTIPYSSAGPYSTLHVAMEMFAAEANIRLLHVPYQGGGPALTALLSGTVQALASGPGPVLPHVREGRLRALASWGEARAPGFEDVPTFRERGLAEVLFYIWAGVFAPAATPAPLVARITAAVRQAAQDAETRGALTAAGSPPAWQEGDDFSAFFRADSARLVRAVQRIGKVD